MVQVRKLNTLTGHTDCVYSLESGHSQNLFFSGAGDGIVALWDLNRPDPAQMIARLPNSIYALHHMKLSDLLIVGHNYDGVHLIDWKEKKELRSLQITSAAIFDIQSQGNNLFIASGDGALNLVDMEKWTVKKKVPISSKSARTLAINPVRGELAVGFSDCAIRIFDLETLQLKQEWRAHENSVFTLAFSRDYKILLSGSRDARLKAWDAGHHYHMVGEVAAHLYAINHIAFSPDGKHFVTCSLDKSIKVWQTDELRLLKVIDKARHAGHGTSVNKLLWTSFDNQLVSASDDRTISVWNFIFSQE
jgi:WD40 repeat protein